MSDADEGKGFHLSDDMKRWIERLLIAGVSTLASGGVTSTVKNGEISQIEHLLVRFEAIADVCQEHVYHKEGPESDLWRKQTDAVEGAESEPPE